MTFITSHAGHLHLSATTWQAILEPAENGWIVPFEEILTTKLFVPQVRSEFVRRPRLAGRLNEATACDLTLVSAPAGFGKTTLVSTWVGELRSNGKGQAANVAAIGWLSLDEADADPERFLAYLIAVLGHSGAIDNGAEEEAMAMLHSAQPPPTDAILTFLINQLASTSGHKVLVLDDYHLVDSSPVVETLSFLLDHLPPQAHLVIATRVDPQLPLSRLRATGRLAEIRAADLRFTSAEAAEFLNRVMGLQLSEEDVLALENRTEGWIAGLQLAALSLKGRQDTRDLISAFTGSHRLVLDYLLEEVLAQQSDEVETFLYLTALLDRMNGALCDAVTGQEKGQATLEMLDHANMFVVPLDQERRWYRYHRLFADLLRQRLRHLYPDQPPVLHLRASNWYENNGFTEQAIRHAIQARDYDRAASLAEQAWRSMHMNYGGVTWLRWIEAIPDDVVRRRPVLSTGYGWSLIDSGDLVGADLCLKDAERWLEATANVPRQSGELGERRAALGGESLQSLAGSIANARAYLSQALGDVRSTVEHADRARELLPELDVFERGLSAILPGFAHWSDGELELARREMSEAIACMRIEGRMPFVISFTSYLADVMIAQGRLNEAKETYLQLLDLVAARGPDLKEVAVVRLGLSEIYHEQGNMEAAKEQLRKGEALGELPAFPPWYRHWVSARMRVMASTGDSESVSQVLDEARRLYYRHPIPDIRPLSALAARHDLDTGRMDQALLWASEQGLTADDELSYLREFEHMTFARILISQSRASRQDGFIQDALRLLDRLLGAAETNERTGSVIETLILQALAHAASGHRAQALASLTRAIGLAEPEGYIFVFIKEGAPLAALLRDVRSDDPMLMTYTSRLLDASLELGLHPAPGQTLVEQLSDRELEVLEHLANGNTNQAIGDTLFLSINTVKAHTRNIYGKLGVNNRTQAVARARELGLIGI